MEATEGKILIDGINIADVGLADLRSRLTIIPRACGHFTTSGCSLGFTCLSRFEEDPTILSGTLRSTLDVFNEYDDVEIVRTLSHGDSRPFYTQILSVRSAASCSFNPV